MARQPLEAGTAGKAPVVAAAIPRAHHARLRELAAARGLTTSGLLRLFVGQGLNDMAQGDDNDRTMQEARKGGSRSAAPGYLNASAGDRPAELDTNSERRRLPCPSTATITVPGDT